MKSLASFALLFWTALPTYPQAIDLRLPLQDKSLRFAVIGDSGTGLGPQYDVAKLMAQYHQKFPFDFVIMLGDNIYGGHSASDLKKKFEDPYQPLLQAGVKFYASLGNHDDPATEMSYKPFNMNGKRYYDFRSGNAHFFALDSDYMDPDQLTWLQQNLSADDSSWKLVFFHHPLYDDAKFHGADPDLRSELEPIFIKTGVNVVLSGHEHVYERIKPQHGIYYFVLGNSGQLRAHNLNPSDQMAKGFDTDRDFMLVEIAGDQLYFQTISRTGETVDSDVLKKQPKTAQ
jgi:DNA repair exonuclease SbcCD nuclease subunit